MPASTPANVDEARWTQAYRYAAQHSPYYRELFANLGLSPDEPPALEELPLTDKATLSERNLDFLCVPRERVVETVTTSGSTGHPLLWMLTANDLDRLARNEEQSFTCAGLTPRDRVLITVTLDRCFVAGLAYWLGLQRIGCEVVRPGPSSPEMTADLVARVRPTVLVGVPTYLMRVAEIARQHGQSVRVDKLVCVGEPLRQADGALNRLGRALAEAWSARVHASYGITELANSTCECEHGCGGHVHTDQLIVECVDGEIVATTLGVEAMPLIRYRTGDCAELFTEPCACGRVEPRIGPILARKNQMLKVKGASVYPSTIKAALDERPDLGAYVLIARAREELSDEIEVVYTGEADERAAAHLVKGRARVTPHFRRADAAEVEALQMPADSRKRRWFVDLREPR